MLISRARSAHSASSSNAKSNANVIRHAAAEAVEAMESRVMMSMSLDSAGWTKITPSSDTRQVFVSSSSGSDSNSGLSADAPVKTIAKGVSLLRSGAPDWLELKRGDVFTDNFPNWTKSGKDAQDPMLITSYGDPSADRPWLKTGSKAGFFSDVAFHDLAIVGLKFSANTRDPDSPDFTGTAGGYGFQTVGAINGLLLEDDSFDHYVYNASIQGFTDYAKNISIRRSDFLDSYEIDPGNGSMVKSVGLYASMTDGLDLEANVFDHNGWNEEIPAAHATIWSHDIYLWESNKNAVVKDNIIADAGSHGLQARGGGDIEDNLFLRNPIDLLVGNGSHVTSGGVTGKVVNNVFTEDRDTSGMKRGWAIELGNIKSAVVSDNIIENDTQNAFPAIVLQSDTTADNAAQGVGVNDLTVTRNIIYKWYEAMTIATGYKFGASGDLGINNLTVTDNDFQNTSAQKIINQPQAYNASEESWSNNNYYNAKATSAWFNLGGATTSLSTWQSKIEPTAQNDQVSYPDPGRTVAGYDASIGGANSESAFLVAIRSNNKANWSNALTADSVVQYIRAGFTGSTPQSTDPGNAAPTAKLASAPDITSAGSTSETIKVTFTDDSGVVTSTLGSGDIKVTGPNGYSQTATFISVDNTANGTPRTATYTITAPGGGWDSTDNGSYTVSLIANSVTDTDGTAAASQSLGTFSVNLPAPVVSSTWPTVLWSHFDPAGQTVTVQFSEDISKSVNLSDLRMKNIATFALIPYDQMKMSYDKSTFTATWTFMQPIPIADYKIILSAAGVTDASGNHLDANGDGTGGDDYFIYVHAADLSAAATLASLVG